MFWSRPVRGGVIIKMMMMADGAPLIFIMIIIFIRRVGCRHMGSKHSKADDSMVVRYVLVVAQFSVVLLLSFVISGTLHLFSFINLLEMEESLSTGYRRTIIVLRVVPDRPYNSVSLSPDSCTNKRCKD